MRCMPAVILCLPLSQDLEVLLCLCGWPSALSIHDLLHEEFGVVHHADQDQVVNEAAELAWRCGHLDYGPEALLRHIDLSVRQVECERWGCGDPECQVTAHEAEIANIAQVEE